MTHHYCHFCLKDKTSDSFLYLVTGGKVWSNRFISIFPQNKKSKKDLFGLFSYFLFRDHGIFNALCNCLDLLYNFLLEIWPYDLLTLGGHLILTGAEQPKNVGPKGLKRTLFLNPSLHICFIILTGTAQQNFGYAAFSFKWVASMRMMKAKNCNDTKWWGCDWEDYGISYGYGWMTMWLNSMLVSRYSNSGTGTGQYLDYGLRGDYGLPAPTWLSGSDGLFHFGTPN